MLSPHGCMVALVTPFSGGEIDVVALRKHVEFLLADGVSGLVPCGTTGEAATLTEREYVQVVETVANVAAGNVPIIAGAGSSDTRQTVARCQLAFQCGADAVMVVVPPYNKPGSEGQFRHFATVADACDGAVVLYNVPSRTGSNLSAETVRRLVEACPNIVALKEASGNLSQIARILQTSPSLKILAGDDGLALPELSIGAVGLVSVAANLMPNEMVELVEAARVSDMERARALHFRLLDLFDVLFVESNPIPVKTALCEMGRMSDEFRLPLCALHDENRKRLRCVLSDLHLI